VCAISAERDRVDGEIIVVKAEHSQTLHGFEETCAAKNAIDLDLSTRSYTAPGPDGASWMKLLLDRVHCVDMVVRYKDDGSIATTWTCSNTKCTCLGNSCSYFTLTVKNVRSGSDNLLSSPDCKNGDTVELKYTHHLGNFYLYEISVSGKKGEITPGRHDVLFSLGPTALVLKNLHVARFHCYICKRSLCNF
jgi:hypothetical protein